MPYPDNFSVTRYNAAQGRDDLGDDDAEMDWIESALSLLHSAADRLNSVDHSRYGVNATCLKAAADIAAIIAHVREQVL